MDSTSTDLTGIIPVNELLQIWQVCYNSEATSYHEDVLTVLQRTSVVTLSIAGIFKEIVTIPATGLLFHDKLTIINFAGLFVTIGTIAAYNWVKIQKMRENAQIEAHKHHLVEQAAHKGSDRDNKDDTKEENWNIPDRTYVTSDSDILPSPSAFKVKKGESSKTNKQARLRRWRRVRRS
jgi:solute carrier family 35 protein C2